MKWLRQLGEYWQAEYPERDFARVRPLVRLSRLAQLLPAFQKQILKSHALTPTDYSILGALRRAGEPRQLMPGDLYSTLGCTPGGLTKMIDRLEKRGLVERLSDHEDGRRARIRLTELGEVVGREAFADYNDGAEQLMAKLTPEQLATVDAALELLLTCFEPTEGVGYRSPFAAGQRAAHPTARTPRAALGRPAEDSAGHHTRSASSQARRTLGLGN